MQHVVAAELVAKRVNDDVGRAPTMHGDHLVARCVTAVNDSGEHSPLRHAIPLDGRLVVEADLADPEHVEVRRISTAGTFRLHSGQYFLSQALNEEFVGFEEVQDGVWNIL